MTAVRVLRVYHSGVVDEYRNRERLLRSDHGYDVHLVTPPAWMEGGSLVEASSDPDVPTHVVEIRGRPNHPILFWYESSAFRRVIREVDPDIVDLHEEPYSLAVAAALRVVRREAPRAKLCMYTAQNILKRYPVPFRQLERRAYRRVTAAYPCSSEAGEILRAKGYEGSIHVLPLGVSVPIPRERESGTLRIGFVGRLEAYKGTEIALRAFAAAAGELPANLFFVGSGPEEPRLRDLAEQLDIRGKVSLLGAVDQVRALELIGSFDALLIPSLTTRTWKEQFGRVAAQAMIAGTPVIASDSGSLREVVGEAGALVPEGDVEAMGRTLHHLLRDPSLRTQLAERGRRRAAGSFTWPHVAAGVAEMYRSVLTR